jgi:hypothetical protein
MVQKIVIDTRGQTVTKTMKDKITIDIVRKSGGIIKPENIDFL